MTLLANRMYCTALGKGSPFGAPQNFGNCPASSCLVWIAPTTCDTSYRKNLCPSSAGRGLNKNFRFAVITVTHLHSYAIDGLPMVVGSMHSTHGIGIGKAKRRSRRESMKLFTRTTPNLVGGERLTFHLAPDSRSTRKRDRGREEE